MKLFAGKKDWRDDAAITTTHDNDEPREACDLGGRRRRELNVV